MCYYDQRLVKSGFVQTLNYESYTNPLKLAVS